MKSEYELELEQMVAEAPTETPSLVDSFTTGFKSEQRENLPIMSRLLADFAADQKAERLLMDLTDSGQIPESVVSSFIGPGPKDYEGAMRWVDAQGINTEFGIDQFIQERHEEMEALRLSDQQVFNAQGGLGVMSEFAGRMLATFTDPLYLATLPIGIGTATTVFSAAARTALLNVGVEAAALPFIYDWKMDIGADYGRGDVIRHLKGAGAGGFVMGGLGKQFQKLVTRAKTTMNGVTEEGIERMSAVSNEMQDAVNTPRESIATTIEETPEYKKGLEVVGTEQVETPAAAPKAAPKVDKKLEELETKLEATANKNRKAKLRRKINQRKRELAKEGEVVGTEQVKPKAEPQMVVSPYDDLPSVRTAKKIVEDEKNMMDALKQEPCQI